jgi:alpha-glucosidase (family GH31 glycosyl hydrolase)
MFGKFMLVGPVLEEGHVEKTLRVPEGTWVDFWTCERVRGDGGDLTLAAPIGKPVLLVPEDMVPEVALVWKEIGMGACGAEAREEL